VDGRLKRGPPWLRNDGPRITVIGGARKSYERSPLKSREIFQKQNLFQMAMAQPSTNILQSIQ
jgi:hypothetical protein